LRHPSSFDDLSAASPAFPGGTLLAAVFDRDLMRLSDRGGASGIIGDKWAELCSSALGTLSLTSLAPDAPSPLDIERIIRLDDIPQIASAASRRKLQNPDFLLFGLRDGQSALQAADAKFSVETARSRQVSAEVTSQLLELGPVVTQHVGALPADVNVLHGLFLCPDYSLTHHMLNQRRGLRRVAARPDEIVLLPADAQSFLSDVEGSDLIHLLASLDVLSIGLDESLLLSIYYLRLARACVACWQDQTRPLLALKDGRILDLDEVERIAHSLVAHAGSGWNLVVKWDELAEEIRRQRLAVDHVASVPLGGSDLRKQITEAATAAGVEPPSVNRVRRRVGAWYRRELLDAFGPLTPPLDDFSSILDQLGKHANSLRKRIPIETAEIILEMVTEVPKVEIMPSVATA
jgi:hypothetical protein